MKRSRGKNTARRSRVAISPKSQDARRRALDALSLMRAKKWSLTRAAEEALTSPRTVKKYVAVALHKKDSGRYVAKPFDRLARSLRFLTPQGQIAVTVRGSRTASTIAAYWVAVDHYLKSGDEERLGVFRGKAVRVGKEIFFFVTDPRILNRIANAGEVSFEDIYAQTT
jgi:hypothetical protein